MSVLVRYPHTLSYDESIPIVRNEKGDPIELDPIFESSINCKAVPDSGKGQEYTFEDGTVRRLAFTCYFPIQEHVFEYGDRVQLTLSNGVKKVFLVCGFIPYQKQHKLWLA